MIDKEKLLAEIEKRYEYWKEKEHHSHSVESEIRMSECQHLLQLLNSLPEEPVSNPTPNERMSKDRFAEACKAACSDRNYRSHYGYTETRDDYFVDGVQWADEHPIKEPVSEGLTDEIKSWLKQWSEDEMEWSREDIFDTAEHFAKWQKEQIMAKAVEGDITFDYYGDDDKTYGCIAHDSFCLEDFGLEDRDKVKVIVIKED